MNGAFAFCLPTEGGFSDPPFALRLGGSENPTSVKFRILHQARTGRNQLRGGETDFAGDDAFLVRSPIPASNEGTDMSSSIESQCRPVPLPLTT